MFCAFSLSGNESILPDPESLFPTHLHRHPTQREAKPMQCRHIWRYLQRHIPKSGDIFTGGGIQKWIDPAGSRRASRFCDSAIMQTGQRVVIEIHSILRASNTSAILRRSMAVSQIDPLAACVDADTFCVGGCSILGILFFPHFWGKPFPNKLGNKKAWIYSPAYRLVRICA